MDKSMQKYLGANPHAIGVLDLIYDKEKKIHLLIDREVFDSQYFSCPACVDTASIRLRIEDFINRLLPNIDHDMTVVELSWL